MYLFHDDIFSKISNKKNIIQFPKRRYVYKTYIKNNINFRIILQPTIVYSTRGNT